MPTTTAVLLAAGGGSRFAGPTHKLLAPLHGRSVFRHSLDHLLAARRPGVIDHVVVVTGSVPLDLEGLGDEVTVVHNERWALGQSGSVQLGIAAAERWASDAVIVGLADQPFVPASAWETVATASSLKPIVVAVYAGERGPNPVRLRRDVWSELPVEGDEGARPLMRLHPDWVDEVACEGSAADIDTLEDLGLWTSF